MQMFKRTLSKNEDIYSVTYGQLIGVDYHLYFLFDLLRDHKDSFTEYVNAHAQKFVGNLFNNCTNVQLHCT